MNDIQLYEKIPIEEKNFPIRLQHFKSVNNLTPHWHEHIELLFFTKGSANILCGSSQYDVSSGDLLFINSNELHSFEYAQPSDYYCLIINPVFFQDVHFENILINSFIKKDCFIKDCFTEIFNEYQKKSEGWDMVIKSKTYELMTYLLRNYKLAYLPAKEFDARNLKLKRINSVLLYISEHYQENITTASLAKMCYLSEYYFCRFFKNETGMSAISYINKIRADKAAVLLENTSVSITEIAITTGFDDVNYFARVFKKYKQISPSEYRKKAVSD